MVRRDREKTELCGFKDDRSYCRRDGKQVLYGVDWTQRKRELWTRAKGFCEMGTRMLKPHVSGCSGLADEPHHITPRSKGRDDRISNLAGLSHDCHDSLDKRRPRWTVERRDRDE